jgi:hypothetical protein
MKGLAPNANKDFHVKSQLNTSDLHGSEYPTVTLRPERMVLHLFASVVMLFCSRFLFLHGQRTPCCLSLQEENKLYWSGTEEEVL